MVSCFIIIFRAYINFHFNCIIICILNVSSVLSLSIVVFYKSLHYSVRYTISTSFDCNFLVLSSCKS
uniref:Uncharacterized protein n=1 Tax=Anguilla anguilla TaxID=7936 RepID=A0A0E9WZ04_ANGAN